jgi:hypothetical protein
MPRIYDYSHNAELSDRDYIFSVYRNRRDGAGEVSYASLWGPHALFLFDGIHHQFDLRTAAGQSPYDNDLVDPVFDWLCDNAKGGWHWHESQTNNYRSIGTSVYLADAGDIEAFKAKWGDIFAYNEKRTVRNAEWNAMNEDAAARNVLPANVTPERMKFMLKDMDAETGAYLDTISGREGFDDTFVEAFKAAVVYILEKDKPSEFGPRMLDGRWHEGVIGVLREIGNWVRTSASAELHARTADCQIADEDLEQAFLSGLEGPKAPAETAPSP